MYRRQLLCFRNGQSLWNQRGNVDLLEVAKRATVALIGPDGRLLGSAFFVAPGHCLTAAHVVNAAAGSQILIDGGSSAPTAAAVIWRFPSFLPPGLAVYPLPDMALLRVLAPPSPDQICVALGAPGEPGQVHALGYSAAVDQRVRFSSDTALLTYEGVRREQGVELLKFKDASVEPGMSGGPVLDLQLGCIIGITKASRGVGTVSGSYAVSISELERRDSQMWAANKLFHRRNSVWQGARTSDLLGLNPAEATRGMAAAVLQGIMRRSAHLPTGVDRAKLHQTIWVRRRVDNRPSNVGNIDLLRFRWSARRTLARLTLIVGGAGFGKSWLISHQTQSLAERLLQELQAGADELSCHIPLLFDCSLLASHVPAGGLDVAGFLAAAVHATMPGLTSAHPVEGYVRLLAKALDDGRLTLCLDGLDEVPTGQRTAFRRGLVALLEKNNRVFVTSRPSTANLLNDIATSDRSDIEILGFQRREQVNFVQAWYARRPADAASLVDLLSKETELAPLARVPLLLSFLCRVVDSDDSNPQVPGTVAALYRRVCLHLLSGRWRDNAGRDEAELAVLPDPQERLSILSRVVGRLQDRWRDTGEEISRSAFSAGLRADAAFDVVDATAVARFREREAGSVPGGLEREAILWELVHDGVLVETVGEGLVPSLRFSHPIIREYVLANYFVQLDESERIECLERHLWFDPQWRRVIGLAGQLTDPTHLVAHLLRAGSDIWVSKRWFAAELLAELSTAPDGLARELVDSLLASTASTNRFERNRAAGALGTLVAGHLVEARDWGIERLQELDAAKPIDELHQVLAAALVGVGFDGSLRIARRCLTAVEVSQAVKHRILTSLVHSGQAAELELALEYIAEDRPLATLNAFLAGIRPQQQSGIDAALAVLRKRDLVATAGEAIATTLSTCGDAAVGELIAIAEDFTMSWAVRAHVCLALLRAGVEPAPEIAMGLVQSPNLTLDLRAALVVRLLDDGFVEALESAASLILQNALSWQRRASIARAIADLGDNGVDLLVAQLQFQGIPLDLMLRHICALVHIGRPEGMEVAARLHIDSGVAAWIRGSLIEALLDQDRSLVSEAAVQELLSNDQMSLEFRFSMTVDLFRLGSDSALAVLRSLLNNEAVDDTNTLVWQDYSRRIAAEGHRGPEALARVSTDTSLQAWVRSQALVSLAALPESQLRPIVDAVVLGLEDFWQSRVYLSLGLLGAAPDVPRLLDETQRYKGGYRVLFEYLNRGSIDQQILANCLAAGERILNNRGLDAPPDADPATSKLKTIRLNADLLAELGIEMESEDEAPHYLNLIYKRIERIMGSRIAQHMVPQQLTEFEDFVDRKDEAEALSWLNDEFPEYRRVVRQVFDEMCVSIRSGTLRIPPPDRTGHRNEPLFAIANVARPLGQWVGHALAGRWDEWLRFAATHATYFGSVLAADVTALAAHTDTAWGPHEAHVFALRVFHNEGFPGLQRLVHTNGYVHDLIRADLDSESFESMLLVAAFACTRHSTDASSWFYAAIAGSRVAGEQLGVSLMRKSRSHATADQRQAGARTLRELRERLGWTEEYAELLISILEENDPTPGTE